MSTTATTTKVATSKSSNRIYLEFTVVFDEVLSKTWSDFNTKLTAVNQSAKSDQMPSALKLQNKIVSQKSELSV